LLLLLRKLILCISSLRPFAERKPAPLNPLDKDLVCRIVVEDMLLTKNNPLFN